MIAVLVASGSCRSVIVASCFSARVREVIVVSASPFFFMSSVKFIRSWVVFVVRLASVSILVASVNKPASD